MSKCCIKSTDVTATATSLEITIPEMTFQNCCKYRISVCQEIPCSALGLPVIVKSGATEIPVWTTGCALPVLADYVKKQMVRGDSACNRNYIIPVQYVNSEIDTNPEHFTALCRIKACCDI